MNILTTEKSKYQDITVYEVNELYGETGKYRVLRFSDHAVQGALDLKDPQRIVLEYPRAIIHLMEANNPFFENVFMIGHGIGTIASHYANKNFRTAEIDEKIVELSREYFGYRQDNVVIGDGLGLLSREDSSRFDHIIVDAFSGADTPRHLTSLSFFRLTQEKLTQRGSVILNLIGRVKNDRLLSAIHTTLKEVYPCTKAYSLSGGDVFEARNVLLVGSAEKIEFDPRAMAGFIEVQVEEGHVIL